MIVVHRSPTADTRTCDHTKVSKEELFRSSEQHIEDVRAALKFFRALLAERAVCHDADKLTNIDEFYADFQTGFAQTGWFDQHRWFTRHHLQHEDGIRDDVNLIDVLEFICDCVMAGMARSGSVYPIHPTSELLARAFQNTVTLLQEQIVMAPDETPGPVA